MSALVQQSSAWLEMRKNKIGASDAPVIMQVSPWATPYQLWETKLGIRPEKPKTKRMEDGLNKEEKARKKFEELTDIIVLPQVVFHPDYKWMMASLDGMDLEQKYIVELKCPGIEDHTIAKNGEIPEKYYPQLQHQLEVCGLDMAYYLSYYERIEGDEIIVDTALLECRRNTKYIKKMIDQEEDFYKCMQDFVAPKLSARDYEYKEDEVWSACAIEYLILDKEIMEREKRQKELKDMLVSMSRGQNSIGGGVRVCKMVRKGIIDYSKIPELKEVDLESYRKEPIECWKISKA